MRTRALHTWTDEAGQKHTNVVWFGVSRFTKGGFDISKWDLSKFDTDINKQEFYNSIDKNAGISFSDKQQAICDSLTQRLYILKGELWYNVKYGLPLTDRTAKKVDYDAFVLTTITSHPDVDSIISFTSSVNNHRYTCNVQIQSVYGQIDINI